MLKITLPFFLLIFLVGCSQTENSTTSAISNSNYSSPPKVELKINNEIHLTKQGSNCWKSENVTKCVAMASPVEIAHTIEAIKVSRNEKITILSKSEPNTQSISLINTEDQIQELKIKDSTFSAPKERGTYVIHYYAIWNNTDTETSGDSSYIYKIEVK